MHSKKQEHAWSDRPSFQSRSPSQNCTWSLSSFLILGLYLHLLHVFQVLEFPCLSHLQALVQVAQMKGNLTQVSKGKGSLKRPSQIQRCLIIQALKHFIFLPKPPISFFFFYFCSTSKMTTTYSTRWICSEGIVTDAILPRKITFRLSSFKSSFKMRVCPFADIPSLHVVF